MLVEHHREKLLNAAIYFVKHTKHCGKTKLCKLLYFLDFMHFRETSKSVTGLDYFAWDFGPVPVDFYMEMNNPLPDLVKSVYIPDTSDKSFTNLKAKKKFDDKYFTKREIQLLEKISYIFEEALAEQMVETSHLPNHPWDKTIQSKGEKAKINYFLALDKAADSLSLEEATERVKDREAIRKAFR